MAVEPFATGTLSTTGSGTEDFLSSPNEPGVFQLVADLNDMADGDVIEFAVYMIVLTGGTARISDWDRREGLQPTTDKIIRSLPVATDLSETNALRFSIRQVAGTAGVSIPWKVLKIA